MSHLDGCAMCRAFVGSAPFRRGEERAAAALALGEVEAGSAAESKAEWAAAQLSERLAWDKPT